MNNFLGMMRQIKSPQAFMQNALNNSQFMQNPMARNAIEMMQKGDTKGTEQMARNILQNMGLNPDEVYKEVSTMYGNR